MLPDVCHDIDFLQWLDTLSDEEHHAVLLSLRQTATDLGVTIDRKSPTAQDLLNLSPHSRGIISLN
jgi:hypothetical protein